MYGTWFTVTFGLVLVVVLLIGLVASAWTPVFALIVAVPLFLVFLAWRGMSRSKEGAAQAERGTASSEAAPASEPSASSGGMWGERRGEGAPESGEGG
jgi:hypothetical protein